MAGLELPLYLLVGDQPVSMLRTASGGAELLGWDFERGEMTREAASWDDVVGNSDGTTRKISKKEFDAAVARLRDT